MTNDYCENLIASWFITTDSTLMKTAYDLKKFFS